MTTHGDSYCGIFCGACSVRRHGETGRADGFISCCVGVPAADLACGGCKSSDVYAGCRVCTFRDCARARGVEHCVECADYPCAAYRKWSSMKRLLPHVSEAPASLEAIRRDGAEVWAAVQDRRWSCPGCGAPFSWYERRCAACGRGLECEAYALSGLRKLVCRVVIPGVYRKGRSKHPNPNR